MRRVNTKISNSPELNSTHRSPDHARCGLGVAFDVLSPHKPGYSKKYQFAHKASVRKR